MTTHSNRNNIPHKAASLRAQRGVWLFLSLLAFIVTSLILLTVLADDVYASYAHMSCKGDAPVIEGDSKRLRFVLHSHDLSESNIVIFFHLTTQTYTDPGPGATKGTDFPNWNSKYVQYRGTDDRNFWELYTILAKGPG